MKESGRLFAFPTYLYIVILDRARRPRADEVVLRLVRRHRARSRSIAEASRSGARRPAARSACSCILKGFSSGAVALTGVEAISNGVPAFRRPESKNAADDARVRWRSSSARCSSACRCSRTACTRTRATTSPCSRRWASRCSATTSCSGSCSSRPPASSRSPRTPPTPTSRACRRSSPATATCRASSPTAATGSCSRTASSCSRVAAGVLIVAFGGVTNALIPLYAVGVFLSFTLSQTGMVRHHLKEREPNWQRGVAINGVGAVATAIVTLIVATTKFTSGAWVPLVVIPMIVLLFKAIKQHYDTVARRLAGRRRLQAAPHEPHGRRARRQHAPRRARSARVREVARAEPSRRGHDRRPTRRSRSGSRRRGPNARPRHPARDRALAVPGARAADPALHRRARRPLRERHRHRRACPSSSSRRGGRTCSTTRAPCSSRAGCCSARARSSPRCRTTSRADADGKRPASVRSRRVPLDLTFWATKT